MWILQKALIPHYAEKALPISELLKEGEPFVWTTAQEQSFQMLKEHLVS